MRSDPDGVTYLYNTYYSYRKEKNTFLIEDTEVVKTILRHFKYYYNLSDAFIDLFAKSLHQTTDTSYGVAVLGLYYSLPEFSYCFAKRGEDLEDVEIPLSELTADSADDILTCSDDVPPFKDNLVRKFKGNLVNAGEFSTVSLKIDTYFRELVSEIDKADPKKLTSIIKRMDICIPRCVGEGLGSVFGGEVYLAVLQFVERSCTMMKLFELDKDIVIERGLKESPMLLQRSIPGSRSSLSYRTRYLKKKEFETAQPFECPTPSMNFMLSTHSEVYGNNGDETTNRDSIEELPEELKKHLAIQALTSHSNMAFISDGRSFYVLWFDFDSDGMDIPFTYSCCNAGFSDGYTPAQFIHSMVYDRLRSFIGEKQKDGFKNLAEDFGKYRSKYFNFDSIDIYGCSSGERTPQAVKSKYKFHFTIIQDSEGWYLNLVFKLSLEACIQGFKLDINRDLLKDEDEEVIVKLLDAEFLKDWLREKYMYPLEQYEKKVLEDFEKEIDVYEKIQRHNEENPFELIHIPQLLGSGSIDTFVDTDSYSMRLLTGPVMVLEYLKGMRHPKTIDEFQKAEIEIERLACLGFKHKDIRAKNILYDPVEEIAFLLDFQYTSFDENLDPAAVVSDFRKEYTEFLESGSDDCSDDN